MPMQPKAYPCLARSLAPSALLALLLGFGNAACMLQHHANTNPLAAVKSNQPDKTLFDISMADLDKGKYAIARLNLETLLNTYPDSEYLARAKMAIADSWFREGGAEGMAEAEAQYKDFITFFPAMKEASEAQLKVAEIHYRQLQKPDRDPTEADRAQAELRTFLINYPDSPLRPQAVQMLRETQEVLAEREYRIADFYLERAQQGDYNDYRAAQSRLEETLAKYPLYSRGDVALDQLANSYLTTSKLYAGAARLQGTPQGRDLYNANADADRAKSIADFDHLLDRYPLSPDARDASTQLAGLHAPVPKPSQESVVFNRQEIGERAKLPKNKGFSIAGLNVSGIWTGKPTEEMARADQIGSPLLSEPDTPPPDPLPGLDALLKQTMIASGAIKPGPANVGLGVALTGTGTTAPNPGASDAPPSTVAASTAPANAPLQLANVPDKPRGADTPESSTPQAMSGNNNDDPNARHTTVAPASSVVLTPNEIDIENREQMLAAEIHRDVPAPVAQLQKDAKKQEEIRAKLLAQSKKQQADAKSKPVSDPPAAGGGASASAPAPTAPAKSKSWFHIWD